MKKEKKKVGGKKEKYIEKRRWENGESSSETKRGMAKKNKK